MPDLFFPSYTKKILSALNAAGYEAYLVGGAVRDLLLGKSPDDYDITTNALPEQVLAVCSQHRWKTVDQLGHNFGCVVIVINGVATEVTTFRGERYNDEICTVLQQRGFAAACARICAAVILQSTLWRCHLTAHCMITLAVSRIYSRKFCAP